MYYNVTLKRVRLTIIAMEKQQYLKLFLLSIYMLESKINS